MIQKRINGAGASGAAETPSPGVSASTPGQAEQQATVSERLRRLAACPPAVMSMARWEPVRDELLELARIVESAGTFFHAFTSIVKAVLEAPSGPPHVHAEKDVPSQGDGSTAQPAACEFCAPAGARICGEMHRKGFVCTREHGHYGEHVACASGYGNHVLEAWGASEEVER